MKSESNVNEYCCVLTSQSHYLCPCTDKSLCPHHLSPPLSYLPASTPSIWPLLSLKYATACRYTACLAGGGASPGQTEGAGGGAHWGEAQPAQICAPEPPVPPDLGLAEVCPASQRPGKLKMISRYPLLVQVFIIMQRARLQEYLINSKLTFSWKQCSIHFWKPNWAFQTPCMLN